LKRSRLGISIITLIMVMVFHNRTAVPSLAETDDEYKVAAYDVTVVLNRDGSADVREKIDFTFYDGFNNIMIPIARNEGEEIEINHVYMQRKDKLIECKRLMAGQWDAEVFTGTYSVIDEPDHVKLKIYGSFYRSFGSVTIYYKVKNAIRRYRDVAEYQRTHIPKLWETRISSINIAVRLPEPAGSDEIAFWFHGVFVGAKELIYSQIVNFNVPDTVPGEYVETRIIFPQSQVPDCPVTDDSPNRSRIIAEEMEYQASDKADLLEARENAARRAGQKAYYERMRLRARNALSILSIILTLAAAYYILFMQKKLRHHKKKPIPDVFRDIDRLDPAEVRMLVANGRTGARAMLGKLMELTARGVIGLGTRRGLDNKVRFTFVLPGRPGNLLLNQADSYFIEWMTGLSPSNHEFDPIQLLGFMDSEEKAGTLKAAFDGWVLRVKEAYHGKNILDGSIVKYRNFGIVSGVLLLFLGLFIPIAFSVAMGYLILPSGFLLLTYSLRIRKHTEYGTEQHRIWKTIRLRIRKRTLTRDALPEWMRSCPALLGYGVALGIENEIARWIATSGQNYHDSGDCPICAHFQTGEPKDHGLDRVVKNTLSIMDEAVSSVQDA